MRTHWLTVSPVTSYSRLVGCQAKHGRKLSALGAVQAHGHPGQHRPHRSFTMGSVSLLSDRDVLLDAAACLGQLCPKGQSAWQCPVPGCTRQDSDAEYLQSHILADHFDFVKVGTSRSTSIASARAQAPKSKRAHTRCRTSAGTRSRPLTPCASLSAALREMPLQQRPPALLLARCVAQCGSLAGQLTRADASLH